MPWTKVQPEIVQTTAGFEHQVAETWLPISQRVLDNPIALDTANGVFNADPNTCNQAIAHLVGVGQLPPLGFFVGCRMATPSSRKP